MGLPRSNQLWQGQRVLSAVVGAVVRGPVVRFASGLPPVLA
jgi:hypothetical protein